jgi:AraC-like DNA-binding protein
VVISFDCSSPAIRCFEGRILKIGDYEKNLLACILREAKEAYSSPLDTPSLKKLEKKPDSLLGCEQLVRIYLEQMLIFLIRKGKSENNRSKLSTSAKERSDSDLMWRITDYLNANICNGVTFEDVCKFSRLSGTNLKVLFRQKAGMGVMEYYRRLKIEEAKEMIREEEHNITGIANLLGYSSIHYFSRHFKKSTGMSPSEYAISVKVKI